jgi:hypothetical protein
VSPLPPGRHSNGPEPVAQHYESEEQAALNAMYRRRMVVVILRNVSDADDLVFLTAALELDQELDELATTSERQRLIAAARERLELTLPGPADDR